MAPHPAELKTNVAGRPMGQGEAPGGDFELSRALQDSQNPEIRYVTVTVAVTSPTYICHGGRLGLSGTSLIDLLSPH